jgi:hypothetical protein
MNPTALQPFITTALPIMFTVLIAAWMNNKGIDGIHKRLDDIIVRLGRIEANSRITMSQTSAWKREPRRSEELGDKVGAAI